MLTALIFIVVGLLLVLIEFFVPGGVIGVTGAILVVVGLVLFGVTSPSVILTILVVIFTLGILGVAIRFLIHRLQKSKEGGGIYLTDDQEGYRASDWAAELIGEEGEVVANLKASGHIEVKGKRYQAVSRMGYLERGTKIVVIGGEGAHLIVKKKETS